MPATAPPPACLWRHCCQTRSPPPPPPPPPLQLTLACLYNRLLRRSYVGYVRRRLHYYSVISSAFAQRGFRRVDIFLL